MAAVVEAARVHSVRGVVFRCTILSRVSFLYTSTVGCPEEDGRSSLIVVVKGASSCIKRCLKVGDLVDFTGVWEKPGQLLVESLDNARVVQMRHLSGAECQVLQAEFKAREQAPKRISERAKRNDASRGSTRRAHKKVSGAGKRLQAEKVADLLLHMFAEMSKSSNSDTDAARQLLSSGSGVIDAAGGSGFVSFALSMRGVKSTVVDPRRSAGCLPRRDRKSLRKALQRRPGEVVQFDVFRAWFGEKPTGADFDFDGGEDGFIPVCSSDSGDGLLSSCSAVVALHPDEATGAIVEWAVRARKPFLVVPCCVFSRLFS